MRCHINSGFDSLQPYHTRACARSSKLRIYDKTGVIYLYGRSIDMEAPLASGVAVAPRSTAIMECGERHHIKNVSPISSQSIDMEVWAPPLNSAAVRCAIRTPPGVESSKDTNVHRRIHFAGAAGSSRSPSAA
jgi:hypothetical protein